ncbi:MAG: hypothetical protein MJ252_09710 [archaeon]|nr:hypothetical protein [archaeon]
MGGGETGLTKIKDFGEKKKLTKQSLASIPDAILPPNLESTGMVTDEINEYLPKPETYEMDVQTEDRNDRPQTPLFNPVKYGEDKGTQIQKGDPDLFDFDMEVEPICNVLTFKTLEEARMEVLEEDEIKEMKEQEQEFERIRNRQLNIVQKLENRERRRKEEKERRDLEKKLRADMGKIYHKKLISCVYSKKLLSSLKQGSLTTLELQGLLRRPLSNEYQTKLVPTLQEANEFVYNQEKIVLDEVDFLFDDFSRENIIKTHKESKEKERQRLEEVQRQLEEKQKQIEEEKRKRKEERERRRHEKELDALKTQIRQELFKGADFIDEPDLITNINGYHLLETKLSPVIGGHFSQFCFFLEILFKKYSHKFAEYKYVITEEDEKGKAPAGAPVQEPPSQPEEEKVISPEEEAQNKEEFLNKIVDLYLMKSKPFIILYTNEQLEQFKQIEPEFTFDNLYTLKSEEHFKEIVNNLIENSFVNDELMDKIIEVFERVTEITEVKQFMKEIYLKIFEVLKNNKNNPPELDHKGQIKFMLTEKKEIPKDFYFGVCNFDTEHVKNPDKEVDINKVMQAKKYKKVLPFFEPYFSEKTFFSNLASEKMKIIAFNDNFEKLLRNNLFECVSTLIKDFKPEDNENTSKDYELFATEFKNEILKMYEKEMLEMKINSYDIVPMSQEQGEAQPKEE